MKKYFMICFRGCLNGKQTFVDLLVIELNEEKNSSPAMFVYDLIDYLYQKKGRGKLGPKNGYQTSGWLDVLRIHKVPEIYKEKVVKISSFDMDEVYRAIKPHLREAINQKIKIKGKGR